MGDLIEFNKDFNKKKSTRPKPIDSYQEMKDMILSEVSKMGKDIDNFEFDDAIGEALNEMIMTASENDTTRKKLKNKNKGKKNK